MNYRLGLTGTFGSGKSTVAAILHEHYGAAVIDADELARQAVEPGTEGLEEVRRQFGEQYIDGEGRLLRRELGRMVFADRGAKARLEAIIHPHVLAEMNRLIHAWASRPMIVLDVPLLFEAGMQGLADSVAVVTIDERSRFQRLRAHGFSEEEVTRRLGMQWPQARKRALADHLIDNSGSLVETQHQVDDLIKQLKGVIPLPR
ncbi:dephospho-CoA kinase [bacterium]|nr:dephospho-CoA kinase [bacterium]